jgi:hypothetical protein
MARWSAPDIPGSYSYTWNIQFKLVHANVERGFIDFVRD